MEWFGSREPTRNGIKQSLQLPLSLHRLLPMWQLPSCSCCRYLCWGCCWQMISGGVWSWQRYGITILQALNRRIWENASVPQFRCGQKRQATDFPRSWMVTNTLDTPHLNCKSLELIKELLSGIQRYPLCCFD